MNIRILMLVVFAVIALPVYGNVGYFDAYGRTIQLQKTADIQMVSEEVNIYLLRAGGRVTGSLQYTDRAKYYCKFKMKNLTNKEITVPMGFPLSTAAQYRLQDGGSKQAEIIANYNFVVGTADGSYAVHYIPCDNNNEYGNIFLWDVTFKPNQTIDLIVSYEMTGYSGMGSAAKENRNRIIITVNSPRYLDCLTTSVTQRFGYVTTTGKSWAGNIEKAVFRVYIGEFEDYLNKRGVFEELPTDPYYEKKQTHPKFATLARDIQPAGWTETQEKNFGKCLTWEYTNFKPSPNTDILIAYHFICIPSNLAEYERLTNTRKAEFAKKLKQMSRLKERPNKQNIRSLPSWEHAKQERDECESALSPQADKNIADVILEFYGIKTDNPEIKTFLERQVWYPGKNPPKIDPRLKKKLLDTSGQKILP